MLVEPRAGKFGRVGALVEQVLAWLLQEPGHGVDGLVNRGRPKQPMLAGKHRFVARLKTGDMGHSRGKRYGKTIGKVIGGRGEVIPAHGHPRTSVYLPLPVVGHRTAIVWEARPTVTETGETRTEALMKQPG